MFNVYCSGTSYINNHENYATIKYNSSGVQQWAQYYHLDSNSNDVSSAITIDLQNNIYITGLSISNPNQFVTIKYNSSGVQQWVMTHDGGGAAIKVDKNYNVYVAGSNNNCTTIKYSQLIGINPISKEIANRFYLSQNYPNPFNPITTISFVVPEKSLVTIKIYDILGREINTLINDNKEAGMYNLTWNGENYSSGIYFYKIFSISGTEKFTETKSMVLIK